MLWIIAAALEAPPPPDPAETRAKAFVTIQRAARATAEAWKAHDAARRREVRVVEKDGRTIVIRIIEFE